MVETDKTVAVEILRQLGGKRFIVMTGAKNFACTDNTAVFQIPRTNGITHVKIILNAMDTYDIEFIGIYGFNEPKIIARVEGIYNDQLQEIFTEKTGLATNLGGF